MIEGIDGCGKGSQTENLVKWLRDKSFSVATLDFPAYDRTPFGKIIGQFLNGEFGDPVSADPYETTLLFSGDRLHERTKIRAMIEKNDFVIVNRYIPSNMAYSCAKLKMLGRSDEIYDFVQFNFRLEYELLKMPKPDHVIILSVSPEQASRQIDTKGERDYITDGETRDKYESDGRLQTVVAEAYENLANGWEDWTILQCHNRTKMEVFEMITQVKTLFNS